MCIFLLFLVILNFLSLGVFEDFPMDGICRWSEMLRPVLGNLDMPHWDLSWFLQKRIAAPPILSLPPAKPRDLDVEAVMSTPPTPDEAASAAPRISKYGWHWLRRGLFLLKLDLQHPVLHLQNLLL